MRKYLFLLLLTTLLFTSCSTEQLNLTNKNTANEDNVIKWAVEESYSISSSALSRFNELLKELGYNFELEFVYISPADNTGSYVGYTQGLLDYEAEHGSLDIVYIGNEDNKHLRGGLLYSGYCISLDDFLSSNLDIKTLFSEEQWKIGSIQNSTFLFPHWPSYPIVKYAFDSNYISENELKEFTGQFHQLDKMWSGATAERPVFFGADMFTMFPLDFIAGVVLSHETGRAENFFSDEGYGDLIRVINNYRFEERIYISNQDSPPETDAFAAYITGNINWNAPDNYQTWEQKSFVVTRLIGLGIRSDSSHQDEALILLKLIHTNSELANLLIYGEEHIDYVIVDGYPNAVGGGPINPIWNEIALGSGIYNGVYPSIGGDWNAMRPQQISSNPLLYMEEFTLPSPFLGFYPDTRGYEQLINDIEYLVYSYIHNVNSTPPLDDNEFEKYLTSLNQGLSDIGFDNWLDEVNRQLDEFFGR